MNVSAVIVTRGDVDLGEIMESIPLAWELLVWDNGERELTIWPPAEDFPRRTNDVRVFQEDVAVYGRYQAIKNASGDVCYLQDDDVVVSDPGLIVRQWQCGDSFDNTSWLRQVPIDQNASYKEAAWRNKPFDYGYVVCNMPSEFRHDFYTDHALVGFGAAFHRSLPHKAFQDFAFGLIKTASGSYAEQVRRIGFGDDPVPLLLGNGSSFGDYAPLNFERTCDIVFTALTPRVLVDVPVRNLPWASADNRMWKQKEHFGERKRMLDLVIKVRDGA